MAAPCKITPEQFAKHAKPLVVTVNGQPLMANPKDVDREGKSLGYYVNGKISVEIDGVLVPCQMSGNLTLIGSKPK